MKKLLIFLSLFITSNVYAEQIGIHNDIHQNTDVLAFDNLDTTRQFYSCRITTYGKQDSETLFINCLMTVKGKLYFLDGKTKIAILESFDLTINKITFPVRKIKVQEGVNKNKELYIHADYIE